MARMLSCRRHHLPGSIRPPRRLAVRQLQIIDLRILEQGLFLRPGAGMRLPNRSWFILAAIGQLLGVGFRYLFNDASEASVANYLRSGFHGIGIALSAWAVQLYFTSRSSHWVRKWPLVVELVIRSLAMAIVVTAVAIGLEAVLNPH